MEGERVRGEKGERKYVIAKEREEKK